MTRRGQICLALLVALAQAAFSHVGSASAQSAPSWVDPRVAYGGFLQRSPDAAFAVVLIGGGAPPSGAFCQAYLNHYHPSAPSRPVDAGRIAYYWPVPNEVAGLRSMTAPDCALRRGAGSEPPFYDYGAANYLLSALNLPSDGPLLVVIERGQDNCLRERGYVDMGRSDTNGFAAQMALFDNYAADRNHWRAGPLKVPDHRFFFAKWGRDALDDIGQGFRAAFAPFIDNSICPQAGLIT